MLVVTIHDVAPPHLDAVKRLRDHAARWGADRVTLLAIPHYHGRSRLGACPDTVRWLRDAADAGDEVALHGFTHRQERPPRGWRARLRCALFTAGEGECLAQGAVEAVGRLAAGRRIVEDIVGRAIGGFVAPAWLEPPRFRRILDALGFGWHETAWSVERVAPPARVRAPVIGFATRSAAREAAAVAWASGLVGLVEHAPVARVALHPADVTSPAVVACAERVIRRLAARHHAVTTSTVLGL